MPREDVNQRAHRTVRETVERFATPSNLIDLHSEQGAADREPTVTVPPGSRGRGTGGRNEREGDRQVHFRFKTDDP